MTQGIGFDRRQLLSLADYLARGLDPSFAYGVIGNLQGDMTRRRSAQAARHQAKAAQRQKTIASVLDQVLTSATSGATYGQATKEAAALAGVAGLGQGATDRVTSRVGSLYPEQQVPVKNPDPAYLQHELGVPTRSGRPGRETSPLYTGPSLDDQYKALRNQDLLSKLQGGGQPDAYKLSDSDAAALLDKARSLARRGLSKEQVIGGLLSGPPSADAQGGSWSATDFLDIFTRYPQQAQSLVDAAFARYGGSANSGRRGPARRGGNPLGASSQGGPASGSGPPPPNAMEAVVGSALTAGGAGLLASLGGVRNAVSTAGMAAREGVMNAGAGLLSRFGSTGPRAAKQVASEGASALRGSDALTGWETGFAPGAAESSGLAGGVAGAVIGGSMADQGRLVAAAANALSQGHSYEEVRATLVRAGMDPAQADATVAEAYRQLGHSGIPA